MNRKWPTIDLLKLYSEGDSKRWNRFLTKAMASHDLDVLKKVLYGIQAGMTDVAAKGLSDKKFTNWFLRLAKSIEVTAMKIIKLKYPHPLDNPLNAKSKDALEFQALKKKRDTELRNFIREASF